MENVLAKRLALPTIAVAFALFIGITGTAWADDVEDAGVKGGSVVVEQQAGATQGTDTPDNTPSVTSGEAAGNVQPSVNEGGEPQDVVNGGSDNSQDINPAQGQQAENPIDNSGLTNDQGGNELEPTGSENEVVPGQDNGVSANTEPTGQTQDNGAAVDNTPSNPADPQTEGNNPAEGDADPVAVEGSVPEATQGETQPVAPSSTEIETQKETPKSAATSASAAEATSNSKEPEANKKSSQAASAALKTASATKAASVPAVVSVKATSSAKSGPKSTTAVSTSAKKKTKSSVKYKSNVDASEVGNNTFRLRAANTKKLIKVSKSSQKNRANVVLANREAKASSQKWSIIGAGGGYYYITSARSGMVLTISGGKAKNLANVIQVGMKRHDAQKWAIRKNADGKTYSFVSKSGNVALTKTKSGNLVVTKFNGKPKTNQKFVMGYAKLIDDGIYSIARQANNKRVLSVPEESRESGTQLQTAFWNSLQSEKYEITEAPSGDNRYYIRSALSGKYIAFDSNGKVVQTTSANKNAWKAVANGKGLAFIAANRASKGKALAVNGKRMAVAANNHKLDASSQQFVVQPRRLIENGQYVLHIGTPENNNVVTINGWSTDDGANAYLTYESGGSDQKFDFTYLGNGTYKLLAGYSGKALAVNDSGNAIQEAYGDEKSQQWTAQLGAGGSVILVNKKTGKALNMQGSTARMSNLNSANVKESVKQRFYLVKQEPLDDYHKRVFDKAVQRGSSTNWYFVTSLENEHTTIVLHRDAEDRPWRIEHEWECSAGQRNRNGHSCTLHADTWIGRSRYKLVDKNGGWVTYYCTNLRNPNGPGSTWYHEYVHYNSWTDTRMGMNISHGCVRLRPENAQWIYDNNWQLNGSSVTLWD